MGKTLKLPAVATGFAIALLPVLFVSLAVAQQKGKKPESPILSQEDKDFYFYLKESQKQLDNRKLKDAVNMLSRAGKIRPDDRAVSEMRVKITPDIEGMKEPRINEFEYVEYTHIKTGIVFVLIPGGTFDMGSDDGGVDEKPAHQITLNDFLIAKHEVIQAVWQEVMLKETKSAVGGGNNPSLCKGNTMPVEHVSWNDCTEFCRKTDLRLPTEAEWEYACRAETKTKYYWGNEIDWSYVWYSDNSENRTHPVCKKNQTGMDCMIWPGMYGNGARTGIKMIIIRTVLRTTLKGRMQAKAAYCAAGHAMIMFFITGRHTATKTALKAGQTFTVSVRLAALIQSKNNGCWHCKIPQGELKTTFTEAVPYCSFPRFSFPVSSVTRQ